MSTSSTAVGPALPKYRWFVLLACWTSFTLTAIDRATWGPAAVFVGNDLGIPVASLGAFATAYYIGYTVSNAASGVLADVIGARRTLTASLFGAGALMMLFGSTSSAALGIAVQALVGLFAGADYSAGVRMITSWFRPHEYGRVLGLFLTATSIGLAVANGVVPAMIAWQGWGTSYHVFGAISIVMAVVLFFILKPGPLGVTPAVPETATRRRFLPDFSLVVRNRNLLVVCAAGFGAFWGLYGFITWANALMIKGSHISAQTAGLVVVVFAIVAAISKPLIGFIADKFFPDRRKVLIITVLGVYGLLLILFGTLSATVSFFWFAVLLGLFAYGATTLMVALVPALVPVKVTGTAAGTSNAIWHLGTIIVPVAVGAVFAATDSFLAAFSTLAAGPLVGMLLMLGAKEPRSGGTDSTDAVEDGSKPARTDAVSTAAIPKEKT